MSDVHRRECPSPLPSTVWDTTQAAQAGLRLPLCLDLDLPMQSPEHKSGSWGLQWGVPWPGCSALAAFAQDPPWLPAFQPWHLPGFRSICWSLGLLQTSGACDSISLSCSLVLLPKILISAHLKNKTASYFSSKR